MTESHFRRNKGPIPDEPPSYDILAITKWSIAEKFPVPSLGIEPESPRYKTNALTTEPKSRFPDAVVRDWLYT